MPAAALAFTDELCRPIARDPAWHVSTFGGNPLALAAVSAFIRVVGAEEILRRATEVGAALLEGLRSICAQSNWVTEVRGIGCLLGLVTESAASASVLSQRLLDHGLLSCSVLRRPNVLRLTPPATLSATDIDEMLTIVSAAIGV